MKTFRIFKLSKIALIAIIICINFVGCSPEDSTETIKGAKKITKMVISDDNSKNIIEFNYDKDGKLISHREIDGITEEIIGTYQYTWSNDRIIMTESDNSEYGTFIIYDGLLQKLTIGSTYHNYSYNTSNRVIRHKSNFPSDNNIATWDEDKLIYSSSSFKDEEWTISNITYGKSCKKGYFPLMHDLLVDFFNFESSHEEIIFIAHPEIAGIHTTQLPINYTYTNIFNNNEHKTNYEYEYEFNNAGYISKITERDGTYITYYSFTWK